MNVCGISIHHHGVSLIFQAASYSSSGGGGYGGGDEWRSRGGGGGGGGGGGPLAGGDGGLSGRGGKGYPYAKSWGPQREVTVIKKDNEGLGENFLSELAYIATIKETPYTN